MLEVIKLYYKHIFSKKIMIVFFLINLLYILALIYSSNVYEGLSFLNLNYSDNLDIFLTDFVSFTKIFTIILNVFIVLILYQRNSLNIEKYLVDKQKMRVKIVYSKLIVSFLISFFIVSLCISVYTNITLYLTPYPLIRKDIFGLFLAFLIQNSFYILLTHLLMSIFPNVLLAFLPIIIFWSMEVNISYQEDNISNINNSLQDLIPNISLVLGKFQLTGDILMILIGFLVMTLLVMFFSIQKDVL